MDPGLALRGVVLPGLIAGLVLAVGWGFFRRGAANTCRAWVVSLAVGAAAVSGHVLRFGWQWTPSEAWRWLGWVACGAALLGMLEGPLARGARMRWVLRLAWTWAALRVVLGYKLERTWAGLEGQLWLAALCAAILGAWFLWERALAGAQGRSGALLLWSVWSAGATMLLFSYSARLAELGGAVCAGLGALVIGTCLRPRASGAGALPVVLLVFGCASVLAVLQGEPDFHPSLFLWVFFSPAGLFLRIGAAGTKLHCCSGFVLALAPAWGAAVIAGISYVPSSYGY